MMRNRGWLIAVIIGIALMTTVCYFTIQRKYTHGIYKRKDYLDRLIEIYFTEQKIMMFF